MCVQPNKPHHAYTSFPSLNKPDRPPSTVPPAEHIFWLQSNDQPLPHTIYQHASHTQYITPQTSRTTVTITISPLRVSHRVMQADNATQNREYI